MATTREDVHRLLDTVPDDQLTEIADFIAKRSDPVLLAVLNAPEDDEPTTEEDLAALAAYRAERARGETVSHDEVKRVMGW